MSEVTEFSIRVLVGTLIGVAMFAVLYSLMTTLLWSWLAAALTVVAMYVMRSQPTVAHVETRIADAAVLGARKLSSLLRRVAA